jgi:hypothetical protein
MRVLTQVLDCTVPPVLPPVAIQLSSTRALFNRANKLEVRQRPEQLCFTPIARFPPTSILEQSNKATTLELQLVPASTTDRANTLDSNIVGLQTTGVGSTGVNTMLCSYAVSTKNQQTESAIGYDHLHNSIERTGPSKWTARQHPTSPLLLATRTYITTNRSPEKIAIALLTT